MKSLLITVFMISISYGEMTFIEAAKKAQTFLETEKFKGQPLSKNFKIRSLVFIPSNEKGDLDHWRASLSKLYEGQIISIFEPPNENDLKEDDSYRVIEILPDGQTKLVVKTINKGAVRVRKVAPSVK